MYSSGVTLQALGARLKRYQAVMIDCVITLGVTMYAIFSVSFSRYLTDFVDAVVVWIAPWCAVYTVDWAMRRFRYVPLGAAADRLGRPDLAGAVASCWPAIIAQLVGMYAAFSGLSTTFHLPRWLNELTNHTRDSAADTARTSASPWASAWPAWCTSCWAGEGVRKQTAQQDTLEHAASDALAAA